jgi:hypothetical protein
MTINEARQLKRPKMPLAREIIETGTVTPQVKAKNKIALMIMIIAMV